MVKICDNIQFINNTSESSHILLKFLSALSDDSKNVILTTKFFKNLFEPKNKNNFGKITKLEISDQIIDFSLNKVLPHFKNLKILVL